jgi:GNAT superfamily N-acetyltransferase
METAVINIPSISDIHFLTDKMNEDFISNGICEPFGIFLRDKQNIILGGCNGSLLYGAIYTDQLWVDKNLRKMGYGKKLMAEVGKLGLAKNCSISTVSTMSFQAREFYEKIGYTVDFERHGYSNGSSCIFLSKTLI